MADDQEILSKIQTCVSNALGVEEEEVEPDKVLSRDQLLELARHRHWDPFDRSIDVRIARLRRKIETDPAKPSLIKTVRGAGYMFVPASDD